MSHRLLRASAGTGKTYQLVQAYIEEVRSGRSPSEILAITFTRKAAQELRARIRRGLVQAGAGRAVITELMHAPIANFHGLALQLLRSFGFAADFAEGVELLGSQGDDLKLFLESCEEAWFSGDQRVTEAVESLAPHLRIDHGLPTALWYALSRAREDGREFEAETLLGCYDAEGLRRAQHDTLVEVHTRLRAALGEQTDKGRATLEQFFAHPLPQADHSLDAWTAGWQRAGGVLHRRGKLGKTISADELKLMRDWVGGPLAAELCNDLVPHLGVLIDAGWGAYTEAKRQTRTADFGDLVEALVQALADRVELHRAVRQRFRAVLVDEAQDTNRLQRRMVRLLAGIDGPAAAEGEPASLFVVGDRKQAIYTFRGADPDSFAAFAEDVRSLGGEETVLTVSRRSSPELIASINSLGRVLFEQDYEPLEALEDSLAGRVALGRPGMTWLELPELGDPAVVAATREANALAAWVAERIDGGDGAGDFAILLSAMSRGPLIAAALNARGIPALLGGGRGLYEQAEIVDSIALVSWLTDASDRLSAAVALRSPAFGLSEAALVSLFAGSEEDDALAALRRGDIIATATGHANDAVGLERAAAVLPRLCAAAEVMGAAELLEYVEAALDVRAVWLALGGGEQRVANLDRLWEIAAAFDSAGRGSAAAFVRTQLDNIERGHKEPLASPAVAQRRAVSISTVHQSKGLEFPVVLLADIRHRGRGDTGPLQYVRDDGITFRPTRLGKRMETDRFARARDRVNDDREREQRRLLYVAATRAEREVIIVGTADPQSRRQGFGRLLDSWRAGAEEEGVLARVDADITVPPEHAPSPAVTPSAEDQAWARNVLARAQPPEAPPGSTFALPVTALETFDQCPRRGFFVHDLRLPEPLDEDPRLRWSADDDRDPALDPLTRGRLAHEVLAAMDRCGADTESFVNTEISLRGYDASDPRLADVRRDVLRFLRSPVGERLLELGSDNRRHELPFRLTVDAAPFVVLIHGQIDLLYWDDDGPVILDYKHARASSKGLDPYATQLDAYALAVERLCGVSGDIRTHLLFLRDLHAPFERVVTRAMRRDLEARIAEVGHMFAAGSQRAWPGRERARCEELRCGFVARCHGVAVEPAAAPEPEADKRGQLLLFPTA